jgi:transcriptional regulator with XRE-family HTH domain
MAVVPARPKDVPIGEKIRRARLEAGLTQAQLAGTVVAPRTISRIERGQVRPSRLVLSYIARRVGKTVQGLTGGGAPDGTEVEYALLRGRVCRARGELAEAGRWLAAAWEAASAAGEVSQQALARLELAGVRVRECWTDSRAAELRAAQREARRHGHHAAAAGTEYDLALGLMERGAVREAYAVLRALVDRHADLGLNLRLRCLLALARCAAELGEPAEGWLARLEEAAGQAGASHVAVMWDAQAAEAHGRGDAPRAIAALRHALCAWGVVDLLRQNALARCYLGQVLHARGDHTGAVGQLRHAHAAALATGDAMVAGQALAALGRAYAALGRMEEVRATVECLRGVVSDALGPLRPIDRASLDGRAGTVRAVVRSGRARRGRFPARDRH